MDEDVEDADYELYESTKTNGIAFHPGESAMSSYQPSSNQARLQNSNMIGYDGEVDGHSSETNSQYAYDQGRPDLLQRLRGMQGYQHNSSAFEQQDGTMSEPKILDAPRNHEMPKNKLNLQIEIDSENDDGRQFSNDNQSSEQID